MSSPRLLDLHLQQGQRPPRRLRGLCRRPSSSTRAAFDQVTGDAVGVIHRLAACPVHLLAGVVLLVADEADVGYFRDGIAEVVEYAASDRPALSVLTCPLEAFVLSSVMACRGTCEPPTLSA
jgi:hypothetical protein